MSQITLQHTASGAVLSVMRQELAAVRKQMAKLTVDFSGIRADLKIFEDRYFREVGALYAELDRLNAEIAQREVDLYGSDAARERARAAWSQAEASRAAAEGEAAPEIDFDPPASLKTLFREVARRIHPDFARSQEESGYLTLLMTRANHAYRTGDTHTLQQMLDDHRELAQCDLQEEERAFEIARLQRQIRHARRDLAALEAERHTVLASDIALLHADAQAASGEGRDFLADMAASLREQVEAARARFALVDKQVAAHGR